MQDSYLDRRLKKEIAKAVAELKNGLVASFTEQGAMSDIGEYQFKSGRLQGVEHLARIIQDVIDDVVRTDPDSDRED